MMDKLRKNWLTILLLAVIAVLLTGQLSRTGTYVTQSGVGSMMAPAAIDSFKTESNISYPNPRIVVPVDQADRIVVKNTNVSLKVKDVKQAITDIQDNAVKLGGFLVESSLNVPEGGATGSISVRIPSDKLEEGLSAIRSSGVKVVSENVVGTDVTDQYVDLGARLETLLKTKAKFDQILTSAVQIQDILTVQRELISLQSQIDAIRGQQKYLEQTARLSLVTVYLATDELALPYAPAQPWRPSVVFKEAVRSLIMTFRGFGSILIWVGVYAPFWLPIMLIIWWFSRRHRR